ncbi:MAG UNVERIFIED_CONTAM: hypothetical protein LVR18_29755 [Planctomycetaceae bacterium]
MKTMSAGRSCANAISTPMVTTIVSQASQPITSNPLHKSALTAIFAGGRKDESGGFFRIWANTHNAVSAGV